MNRLGFKIAQIEIELEHSKRKLQDATIHLTKSRGLVDLAKQQRAEHFLDIDFGLSGTAVSAWTRLSAAFDGLADTKRIWDITDDRRSESERKVATRGIDRETAHLLTSELAAMGSRYKALQWHDASYGDLFVYPGFIIVFQPDRELAILSLSEVKLDFRPINFQEREPCPSDARQVGST